LSIKSRTNLRVYKVTIQCQQNWLFLYVFGLSGERYATRRHCPCQYESNLPAVVHCSRRCASHHRCRSPQQWCRTPHYQSRSPRKREATQSRSELCLCDHLRRAYQSHNIARRVRARTRTVFSVSELSSRVHHLARLRR
jgi:hypothetical protein